MAKIILECDDKNLPTVLNILENLKTGLIKEISVEKLDNVNKRIKPVSSSIDGQINKRYLSRDKYKEKLNQRPQEDEFLPKSTSTGKYLSPSDFRNRNKKGK